MKDALKTGGRVFLCLLYKMHAIHLCYYILIIHHICIENISHMYYFKWCVLNDILDRQWLYSRVSQEGVRTLIDNVPIIIFDKFHFNDNIQPTPELCI